MTPSLDGIALWIRLPSGFATKESIPPMLTNDSGSPDTRQLTRRAFLAHTAFTLPAVALGLADVRAATQAAQTSPIAVFSKVYQELNLNFSDAAEVTAESGLNGVDCPVRSDGEISPESAADQLPRYSGILGQRSLRIWLLTTGITGTSSPHTEDILKTAKSLGIQYYRFGFIHRDPARADQQMREIRAQLKDLAALNRQLGICTLLQNHSPSGQTRYFGGDLADLRQAVEGFDPNEIGVAFDIGHALIVHGEKWREHFEALRPHFKIAYVKDVQRGRGWVPFGQGELARTGYFQLLKDMGYHAPVSLHVEFDWTNKGKTKDRAALIKALQQSTKVLRQWLA